jgi:predicted RNA-binding protein with PIN domain
MMRMKESAELVFDGPGPRDKTDFDNIDGVEVLFAGLGRDADTMIEEKIAANTGPRNLIVVSSDNRLRQAARARKAESVKSEDFWVRLVKDLERPRRAAEEPNGKMRGLSEGETDQWLDFFGLEL